MRDLPSMSLPLKKQKNRDIMKIDELIRFLQIFEITLDEPKSSNAKEERRIALQVTNFIEDLQEQIALLTLNFSKALKKFEAAKNITRRSLKRVIIREKTKREKKKGIK